VIPAEQKYWIEQRQWHHLKRLAHQFQFEPTSGGRCVFHALAGIQAGMELGVRFLVQAGSAHWRYRVCSEGTDTFGYQWHGESIQEWKTLPEMHVWLVTQAPQEEWLVDFSASTFANACPEPWEISGYEHPLWLPLQEAWTLQCTYKASIEATQLVKEWIEQWQHLDSHTG
jgi:hypothetical protein